MGKRVRIRIHCDVVEVVPDDYTPEDVDRWSLAEEAVGPGVNVVDVDEPEWLDA